VSYRQHAHAWDAWRAGEFIGSHDRATDAEGNAALHVRALAAHINGDHPGAIAARDRIDPRYRRLAELDEPILWSYLRSGDFGGAAAFAERRFRDPAHPTRRLTARTAERPLSVEIAGPAEIAYTDDALTPHLPGVAVRVNGVDLIARLDTGGSFLHVSGAQADALGIERIAASKAFASLRMTRIAEGLADLEIGPVRLGNVPVAVHEDGLQADPVASAFDSEVAAIIGTNVLAQFLSTLDGPNKRLLLAPRGGSTPTRGTEVRFALWADHYMFVRGTVGTEPTTLFVDSGLVAVDRDGTQASLLASSKRLRAWRASAARDADLASVPGGIRLGPLARTPARALAVPPRTWRRMTAAWDGVHADALLSYGFLKHHAWTLDFDRYTYRFAT
jgi:hypothetical protein